MQPEGPWGAPLPHGKGALHESAIIHRDHGAHQACVAMQTKPACEHHQSVSCLSVSRQASKPEVQAEQENLSVIMCDGCRPIVAQLTCLRVSNLYGENLQLLLQHSHVSDPVRLSANDQRLAVRPCARL